LISLRVEIELVQRRQNRWQARSAATRDIKGGSGMTADSAARAASLNASLSREQTYVLMLRPNLDAPELASRDELRIRHHEFLVGLERQGILFGAGPFVDRGEKPSGSGMIIIRAESREEAARIAAEEPYTKAGLRLIDIVPWQRNEGSMRLEIRLADGFLRIDERVYTLQKQADS
jgi:uncharacterized protein YciI